MAAYVWVGLVVASGAGRLLGASGPWAVVAGVGGGALLGLRQYRRRVARVDAPPPAPPLATGWRLAAWLVAIAAGVALDALW